jgi:hypothetical protein
MVERHSKQLRSCEEGKQSPSLSFFSLVLSKMLAKFEEAKKAKGNGRSMDDHYKAVLGSKTATHEQKEKALDLLEGPTIKDQAREMMDYLDLPRYDSFKTTVAEALKFSVEDIKKRLDPPTGRYYTNITKLTGGRVFELDQAVERVGAYIKEMSDSGEVELDDEPTINGFYRNRESLNLIIGEDGNIYIEMIHGKHTGIAYGKRSPEMIVRKSVDNASISKFRWENRGLFLNAEELMTLSLGCLPEKLKNSFESVDHLNETLSPKEGKVFLSKTERKRFVKKKVPVKMKKYFKTFEDYVAAFDWEVKEEALTKSEIKQIKAGELPSRFKGVFPSVKKLLEYFVEESEDLNLAKWESKSINFSAEDLEYILRGELPEKWLKIFGSLENFYKAFDEQAMFSTNLTLTDEELSKWQQLVFRILRRIPKDFARSIPDLGDEQYNEIYAERIHVPGYYEVIVSEAEEVGEDGRLVKKDIIKFLDRRDVDNYGF